MWPRAARRQALTACLGVRADVFHSEFVCGTGPHAPFSSKEIVMTRMNQLALSLVAALLCFGASARQAGEAPRGQDNGRHGGKAIDVPEQLMAREAGEAPRGQDHGRRGGKAIESTEQAAA
jgi:hypothetical protein